MSGRVFETSFRTAEMVKYVCNAWHAVKVSFGNEVGTLAKELGVDASAVIDIFSADTKLNISPAYLKPGFAFGGSCLPKDVRALTYRAKELDLNLPLFQSILPSNEEHLDRAFELVLTTGKKKIGMLGLSFKAATDDLRESSSGTAGEAAAWRGTSGPNLGRQRLHGTSPSVPTELILSKSFPILALCYPTV